MYIISGNSNPILANQISKELKVKTIDVTVTRFSDQEVFVDPATVILIGKIVYLLSTSLLFHHNSL